MIDLLTRPMGAILIVVVLYSLISGTIKTIKSAKEELAGNAKGS